MIRMKILSPLVTLSLLFGLSAAAAPSMTEMVAMRDGIRLATDVYLPEEGVAPWPVLLVRTPYDKDGVSQMGEALREYGVAVVVQDTRGRFDSEGLDCIFLCERASDQKDGFDTFAWLDEQTWSDGKVLTFGGSALAIAQYLQAATGPQGLEAMVAEVGTPTFCQHGVFQGGVFRQGLVEGWLQGQGSEFFLEYAREHPYCDEFFDPANSTPDFDQVDAAGLHMGGWYDIFGQGTLDAFVGYQHSGGPGALGTQKLIMGPWPHGLFRRQVGELNYPANASDIPDPGIEVVQGAWLAHYLGLSPDQAAIDAFPTVTYYLMGAVGEASAPGNEWRTADDWPIPAAPVRLYLQADGGLAELCPGEQDGHSSYEYDPSNPSPTVGGANLNLPAGPYDQAEVEARDDLVIFETETLSEGLEVTGRVLAQLWVAIDQADTDLMVRLTDVYPDGRSMLVLDGALRLALLQGKDVFSLVPQNEPLRATVDLWSTAIIFAPGHKLRISITSSNAPRFWPNPNDGTSYGDPNSDPRPVNVTVFHDADHPSFVQIPVPTRPLDDFLECESQPDPDGGLPDGDTDGGQPDGDVPDGDVPDGDVPDGDVPDGDVPDGEDQDGGVDGSADGGADASDLDQGESGGCDCGTGSGGPAGWALLVMVPLWLRIRRRSYSRE